MSSSRRLPFHQLRFALNQPPSGIVLENVSASGGGLAILLRAAVEKVNPELKGNLLVDVSIERAVGPKNAEGHHQERLIPLGTLPAIPFEIVAAGNGGSSDWDPPIE